MNVANVTVDLKGEITNLACMNQISNAYLSGKVPNITMKCMIFCNYWLSSMRENFVNLQNFKSFMRFCPLKRKSIKFENVSFRVFTPKNIISFCGFSYILKRISSKNIELVYAQQCRIRRIGFFVHIGFWFCRGYGSTPCSLF